MENKIYLTGISHISGRYFVGINPAQPVTLMRIRLGASSKYRGLI